MALLKEAAGLPQGTVYHDFDDQLFSLVRGSMEPKERKCPGAAGVAWFWLQGVTSKQEVVRRGTGLVAGIRMCVRPMGPCQKRPNMVDCREG